MNWYLAELVLEHRVEGEPRNVVHFNTVLVEAEAPEDAWERALELGREAESVYPNTDGRPVSVRFRGVRQLHGAAEELEHGAEVQHSQRVGVPEDELVALMPARHELELFAEEPPLEDGEPNVMPQGLLEAMEEEALSGLGALVSTEPGRGPSPEALRFARHAALVAASELRRQGLTDQARGAEYLAEALEHLITLG